MEAGSWEALKGFCQGKTSSREQKMNGFDIEQPAFVASLPASWPNAHHAHNLKHFIVCLWHVCPRAHVHHMGVCSMCIRVHVGITCVCVWCVCPCVHVHHMCVCAWISAKARRRLCYIWSTLYLAQDLKARVSLALLKTQSQMSICQHLLHGCNGASRLDALVFFRVSNAHTDMV